MPKSYWSKAFLPLRQQLTASHFSYNKPVGACPICKGRGIVSVPDLALLIDQTKSIGEFAIQGWDQSYVDRYGASMINASKYYGFAFDIAAPISEYEEAAKDLLLYGVFSKQFIQHFPDIKPPKTVTEGRFEGVVTNIMRRYGEKNPLAPNSVLKSF